jgi:Cu(I)/Ag(I) efflux system membrane fusion protein
LTPTLRVPGTLAWDLTQESVISARAEGLVARLRVKAPYTVVRRGQPLAELLAPGWSSALAEAEALRAAQSRSARELQSAAQQRLRVLGVPSGIGRNGSVTLSAPSDGVVTEVLAREGQTVMPGSPLFRVNGTATVWLEAAVPQADAARLRPGVPVEATVSAVPGQTFTGEVQALLPQVDVVSRTQQARIVLRNPDGVLAPGMFAEVTLEPADGTAVPLVPTEALIATGTDSRLIVQNADASFRPVRVRVGRSAGGRTEILEGLEGGERVVVSGQFLIDSEASLSGALERLGEPAADVPPGMRAPASPPLPEKADDEHRSAHRQAPSGPAQAAGSSAAPARRSCPVAYWYDPMVPDRHFEKPGKSPFMDMQLVPSFAPGADPNCTIRDVAGAARGTQR